MSVSRSAWRAWRRDRTCSPRCSLAKAWSAICRAIARTPRGSAGPAYRVWRDTRPLSSPLTRDFERLLAVLVEEELRIGQPRPHHSPLPSTMRLASAGAMLLNDEEAVCQRALGVEQRKVFLVRLHRQDEAFRRHRQELGPRTRRPARSDARQGRSLRRAGPRRRSARGRPSHRAGELTRDLGAPLGEARNHRASSRSRVA